MQKFDRLLERIEELVAQNIRADIALTDERAKTRKLTSENEMYKRGDEYTAKMERFVESTPELLAQYRAFINPPVAKPDDEMPF